MHQPPLQLASALSSPLQLQALSDIQLDQLNDPCLLAAGVNLRLLRLDLIDPYLGGNKWFKLRPSLGAARMKGCDTILSFGGAYSNHIFALAAAGQRYGFSTIGAIRGELVEPLNSTLAFARQAGMQLHAVSRSDYRLRHDPDFVSRLLADMGSIQQPGKVWIIPEGGADWYGVNGCRQLADLLQPLVPHYGHCEIALACGTGSTMAGVVAGLQNYVWHSRPPTVRGFAVLKGANFLYRDIRGWISDVDRGCGTVPWQLETQYHCGGYAKVTAKLLSFIQDFRARHEIPLEPVYTGKLLYALFKRIEQGLYSPGTELLVLHTGGLRPDA